MTLDELTDAADTIIVAKAVSFASKRRDGRIPVFTETTLEVEQYLKGQGASTLTITLPGGSVGDVTVVAHGMPVMPKGASMVLFLSKQPPNLKGFTVVGLELGAYRLVRKNKELWAVRGTAVEAIDTTSQAPASTAKLAPTAIRYADLELRIQNRVQTAAKAQTTTKSE
ncbi:MAG: hypothetical protein R3A78_11320 [Polyangiales bacterium]|nr:hypothetical protein [Myxococcales bacterium]